MEQITSELLSLFKKGRPIVTDTRKLEKGGIFFALKGANFNGNDFAKKALEGGCEYVVVDEKQYYPENDSRYYLVDNVLKTLQELATAYRYSIEGLHVVGVTGSNGKTTTKELIQAVLAKKYKVHATPGNFNNHIGVPLTLLSMPPNTEIAIIELGDNHPGEIKSLCDISHPDSGLLTNIGKDHIEGFGTIEANINAKKELFDYLEKNQKVVFLNQEDAEVFSLGKDLTTETIPFRYSDITLGENSTSPFVGVKNSKGESCTTHLLGRFNYPNIVCAYTLGKFFNVPESDIIEALCEYQPRNNRSQLIDTGKNTIFMDAYNANPSSVSLALESFEELNTDLNKVSILGEMGELGLISESEHRNTIRQTKDANFHMAIFVGEKYKSLSSEFQEALFFSKRAELEDHLKTKPISNAYILLKGSRSVALEKLLELL